MSVIHTQKTQCCGCSACHEICSIGAISMQEDEEGFVYPHIDTDKCVECGMCEKVCPICSPESGNEPSRVYALKNSNNQVRKNSSSGGAFSLFAEWIIKKNGVVYGCIYDSDIVARHIRAVSQEEYYPMRGSKYVQSDMTGTYQSVAEDLSAGKTVLYTGTPCQVKALENYLRLKKVSKNNLFTVDVICHGVQSPKLFREHIAYLEKKNGSRVVGYYNRFKQKNNAAVQRVEFENGKSDFKSSISQAWTYIYHGNNALRSSCLTCRFADKKRQSDVSFGDYHGIEESHKYFYDYLGVSGVLINTDKGMELLSNSAGKELVETSYEDFSLHQPRLRNSLRYTEKGRKEFWDDYYRCGWEYITKKYGRCNLKDTIKSYILDTRRPYGFIIEKLYRCKRKVERK